MNIVRAASVFVVHIPILLAAAFVLAIIGSYIVDIVGITDSETMNVIIVTTPAIALFLAAYVQLQWHHESQRTAFLSQYASKIFMDEDLSNTFHYLVYTYINDRFTEVEMKLEEDGIARESGHETMYRSLDSLQDGREKGFRFYHPDFFQGSIEEKRLDSLLGYFNIIAYYVRNGLLNWKDINGSIGYHLMVMRRRDVIRKYMEIIERDWHKGDPSYADLYGMGQPFHDLHELLKELGLRRHVKFPNDNEL